MPDLTALRERAIALVDRKRAVAEAVADLRAVEIRIDAAMLAHARGPEDECDDEEAGIEGEAGMVTPLFSPVALHAILGSTDSGDLSHPTWVSNTAYALRRLGELARHDDAVTRGDAPSLEGLTPFEVGAIVEAYKARIATMTEEVRDAGTTVRRLMASHSCIPGYARGRCLGMFGGTDMDTGFSYTERDFDRYATEFVRVPRSDPTDPRGPYESIRTNHHPRVFEPRYLAAVIGPEAAARVGHALSLIEAATAPMPGEPPLLTGFGSHVTNRIEIAYAPGEVELDETPEPAFAP